MSKELFDEVSNNLLKVHKCYSHVNLIFLNYKSELKKPNTKTVIT